AGGGGVTWGDVRYDGNSSAVSLLLTEGVVQACVNERALAAIKLNGSVVTWGSADHGGIPQLLLHFWRRASSKSVDLTAFAAFKANGSLVTWGDADPCAAGTYSSSSGALCYESCTAGAYSSSSDASSCDSDDEQRRTTSQVFKYDAFDEELRIDVKVEVLGLLQEGCRAELLERKAEIELPSGKKGGARIPLRQVEDLEFLAMPWLAKQAEELYGEIALPSRGKGGAPVPLRQSQPW
ncbi:unnamed protein product, partial [Polarella glacialis]